MHIGKDYKFENAPLNSSLQVIKLSSASPPSNSIFPSSANKATRNARVVSSACSYDMHIPDIPWCLSCRHIHLVPFGFTDINGHP